MNLKNYTSTVASAKSIANIEEMLVKAGATDISKKYEKGACVAITFRMYIKAAHVVFFKLPAKVDHCFNVFWNSRQQKRQEHKKGVMEQAERTAWKIVADWVAIQLSMIMLEQAEPLQVFLPYAYDPAKDETLYEKIVNSDLKLLGY